MGDLEGSCRPLCKLFELAGVGTRGLREGFVVGDREARPLKVLPGTTRRGASLSGTVLTVILELLTLVSEEASTLAFGWRSGGKLCDLTILSATKRREVDVLQVG